MSEISTEHAEKIAELVAKLAAEETVRRLSNEEIQPLRREVSEIGKAVTSITTTLFNGGDGGLVHQMTALKDGCIAKHRTLDKLLEKPVSAVRKWAYMFAGTTFGVSIVVGFIYLHEKLPK